MAETPLHQPGPAAQPGPGGRKTPIDSSLMNRVAAGLRWIFGTNQSAPMPSLGAAETESFSAPPVQQQQTDPLNRQLEPWMGPGQPMRPMVPNPADVAGREYDYPAGANLSTRPRRGEGVSFEVLEGLYESLDLVKLCVETRKDQFGNLTWSCLPKQRADSTSSRKPDERCAKIETFFRRPDNRLGYIQWARELVHEQLVFDAPCIYVRRTLGGEVYSLDIVKGSYINVLLDKTGRVPQAPEPAYQHILKNLPAIEYTTDELIYWPRNLRPGHRYGFGPIEQLVMSINIAVRREVEKLNYFTEGNIPEALIGCPESWTPDVIARWQVIWDATQADMSVRRRARFVPGKMAFMPTRSADSLADTADEWWARMICFAFSLPPLPFVKQQNRATAQTAVDEALSEGLSPMMLWFKSLIDHIIEYVFGFADLELVWDAARDIDPVTQDGLDLQQIRMGRKSIDEARVARGEQPIGMGHAIWGIGPMGIMFVDDLLKAKQQGLLLRAFAAATAPPAPDGGMFGGGAPHAALPYSPGGAAPGGLHPDAAAAIQGVPDNLLSAVGLGAGGADGRAVDVTDDDAFQSDPLSNVVAHPTVLTTLREAERRNGRAGP